MEKIQLLKVFSIKNRCKIRLGKDYDGGYVIYDFDNYDKLIGCGVLDDISFEADFIKKYGVDCTVYDGTITKLPYVHPNIKFIRKNISHRNTPIQTNLNDEFKNYNNIFLKMDIEGHEVKWLLNLTKENLSKIKQCVIEFHNPLACHPRGLFTNIEKFTAIQKLNETHLLCHFHGNNGGGAGVMGRYDNVVIPNTFEVTFVRKSDIKEYHNNKERLPCSLDMPNGKNMPDINLNYYPFVW